MTQDKDGAVLLLNSLTAIMQHVSHETSDASASERDHFGLMSDVIYHAGMVMRYATILQVQPDAGAYPRFLTEQLTKLNQAYILYLRTLDPASVQEHIKPL